MDLVLPSFLLLPQVPLVHHWSHPVSASTWWMRRADTVGVNQPDSNASSMRTRRRGLYLGKTLHVPNEGSFVIVPPPKTSQNISELQKNINQQKVFKLERISSTTIRGPKMTKFGSTVGFLLIYSVFFAQLRIPILVCQFKTLPPVRRWNSFTLWAVNTEDSFCYANTIKISISDESKPPFVKAQTETHWLFLLCWLVFCCCFSLRFLHVLCCTQAQFEFIVFDDKYYCNMSPQ